MSTSPDAIFVGAPWLFGGHLETIVPALLPAPAPDGRADTHDVRVAPEAAVRLCVSRPSGRTARGTLLLVHGIAGSAESPYMRRTARTALGAGWVAVRMNCRNCGGTEALSRTLYNAGQSDDVGAVLAFLDRAGFPRPFVAAGFSLGGNLVLRYAGRAGAASLADRVVGINPPVDLEACCRALERRENLLYHAHFTRSLCRQLRRIRAVRALVGPEPVMRTIRTLRRLDSLYTAPDAGYASAEAYYAGASAGPHLAGIRVPSLVVSAANDPFVPGAIFAPHRRLDPARLRFVLPARGGHLGYWSARRPRFWAGEVVVAFAEGSGPAA